MKLMEVGVAQVRGAGEAWLAGSCELAASGSATAWDLW